MSLDLQKILYNFIKSNHCELLKDLNNVDTPTINKLKDLCKKFNERNILLYQGDKCYYLYNGENNLAIVTNVYKPYYDDNLRLYDLKFDESENEGFYNVYSNNDKLSVIN